MSGVVYFLQAGKDGPVKVGWAKSEERLRARIREHQCGNPKDLRLLTFVEGGQDLERAFHRVFDSIRIRGEWFAPSPILLIWAGVPGSPSAWPELSGAPDWTVTKPSEDDVPEDPVIPIETGQAWVRRWEGDDHPAAPVRLSIVGRNFAGLDAEVPCEGWDWRTDDGRRGWMPSAYLAAHYYPAAA